MSEISAERLAELRRAIADGYDTYNEVIGSDDELRALLAAAERAARLEGLLRDSERRNAQLGECLLEAHRDAPARGAVMTGTPTYAWYKRATKLLFDKRDPEVGP